MSRVGCQKMYLTSNILEINHTPKDLTYQVYHHDGLWGERNNYPDEMNLTG